MVIAFLVDALVRTQLTSGQRRGVHDRRVKNQTDDRNKDDGDISTARGVVLSCPSRVANSNKSFNCESYQHKHCRA